MPDHLTFRDRAKAIYGENYRQPLAQATGYSAETIRAYAKGARPVPAPMWRFLDRLQADTAQAREILG
jgi:hypothetical protein